MPLSILLATLSDLDSLLLLMRHLGPLQTFLKPNNETALQIVRHPPPNAPADLPEARPPVWHPLSRHPILLSHSANSKTSSAQDILLPSARPPWLIGRPTQVLEAICLSGAPRNRHRGCRFQAWDSDGCDPYRWRGRSLMRTRASDLPADG